MRASSTGFSANSFSALDLEDTPSSGLPAPRTVSAKSDRGLQKNAKQKAKAAKPASQQALQPASSSTAQQPQVGLNSASKATRSRAAQEPAGPEEEQQPAATVNGHKAASKQVAPQQHTKQQNGHVGNNNIAPKQQQVPHNQGSNLQGRQHVTHVQAHGAQQSQQKQNNVAVHDSVPRKRKPWKRQAARRALVWCLVAATLPTLVTWLVQQEHIKLHHTDMNLSSFNMTVPVPTVEVPSLANITADLQASVAAKLAAWYATMGSANMTWNLQPASILTEWLPSIHMDSLNMTVFDALDKVFAQLPLFSSTSESSASAPGPVRPGQVLAKRGLKAKYPVMIIPGFITSQLELWEGQDCAKRYFRQRMWGTYTMMQIMLRDSSCWMHHIGLDLTTGLDPPGVKLRAAQGLEAVDQFVQGYWVWGKLVESLADVGYDANNLITMAYDWRLAIPLMEARDAWFTRTKGSLEVLLSVTGQPTVLVSHSYGENVARTFLHWVEARAPGWVEKHVHAHITIAGPTLGVPKALTAILSGETYDTAQLGGLSAFLTDRMLPRTTRARLFRSWASMLAMFPVGGPKVWGNTTWAPDDTDSQRSNNRSYGSFIVSAPLQARPARGQGAVPNMSDLQPSQYASPSPLLPPNSNEEAQQQDSGEDEGGMFGNSTAAASADDVLADMGIDCMNCEGTSSAGVRVTPGSEGSDTLATVQASVSACSECAIKKPSAEAAEKLQRATSAKPGAQDSSGLVGTVKNWFSASDEQSATDLLDTTKVHHLDMGHAIQLALRESGALQTSHYQQWGAVHGATANTPPRQAQDEQDVAGIVGDTEASNTPHQQSATAGRSKEQQTRDLPLFPNALTAPLPHAPSMKIYCMYGVGLPTERGYHYLQPDDWSPAKLKKPLETELAAETDMDKKCPSPGQSTELGKDSTKGSCKNSDAEAQQEGSCLNEDAAGQCASPFAKECAASGVSNSSNNTEATGGDETAAQKQKRCLNLEGNFDWKINTALNNPETDLVSGIQLDTGDVTVPLISLGGMCRGGWKSKRLNPAGLQVITREYQHVPVPMLKDPRGGSTSGQHIDILGNEELLTDVLLVATGMEHEVPDRVISRIDDIVTRIPWEDTDGWDWPNMRPDEPKQS